MKRRYKIISSGVLAGIIVLMGVAVYMGTHHLWPFSGKTTTTSDHANPPNMANVTITVQPSKPSNTAQQEQVSTTAQQMLQAPATTLDASGFVQYVYGKVGIPLPRTIAEQSQVGTVINSPNQLEKGDLVFFNLDTNGGTANFDGVYLGADKFAAVTTHGLMEISLSDPYWSGKFQYGRRVL